MTHDLGELGQDRGPVDLTFQWFGTTIRVAPDAGDLGLIAFLEELKTIKSTDTVAAMVVTKEFLCGQVDKRDWDEFLRIAAEHHQQFEDLMKVAKNIVTAVTLFPTGLPSDSSDGQPTTAPKSKGDSSSPAVHQAMADLKGRPDLKMVVWQAQQAKAAERTAA